MKQDFTEKNKWSGKINEQTNWASAEENCVFFTSGFKFWKWRSLLQGKINSCHFCNFFKSCYIVGITVLKLQEVFHSVKGINLW